MSFHSSKDPKNDTFDMNDSYDSEDDLSAITEDRSLRRSPIAREIVKSIDPKPILVEDKRDKSKVMRRLISACGIIFILASAFLVTAVVLVSRSGEETTESEYALDQYPLPTDLFVEVPPTSAPTIWDFSPVLSPPAPTIAPTLSSDNAPGSSTDSPRTAPINRAPSPTAPTLLSASPSRTPKRRIGGNDPFP
jgi:hypothetical protein